MTNQPTKKQRGGDRGGRKPKNPNKRVTVSVCLDPENLELRKQLGRGWNDEVNRALRKLSILRSSYKKKAPAAEGVLDAGDIFNNFVP